MLRVTPHNGVQWLTSLLAPNLVYGPGCARMCVHLPVSQAKERKSRCVEGNLNTLI